MRVSPGVSLTSLRSNVKVCVAVSLPLWGSERVRNFLADKLAAGGGLLAHFDNPVQGQEMLDWFLKS